MFKRFIVKKLPSQVQRFGNARIAAFPFDEFCPFRTREELPMHYFSFHIGDYRSGTAHLSNEEDLAYRRLLEMYYDTELPIPLDTQWVCRRLRIKTQWVISVLDDFFEEREDGWHNARCDEKIAEYRELAERNRTNGRRGGRPRKNLEVRGDVTETQNNPVGSQSLSSGMPVATQPKPDGNPSERQPVTNNHKPLTNNQESNAIPTASDADASPPEKLEAEKATSSPPPEPDPEKQLWDRGLALLRAAGKSEPGSRTLIGKLRKDHTTPVVLEAIARAEREKVSEPAAWLTATCREIDRAATRRRPGLSERFVGLNQQNFRTGLDANGKIL